MLAVEAPVVLLLLIQLNRNSGNPHPGAVPNGYGIATLPQCDKHDSLLSIKAGPAATPTSLYARNGRSAPQTASKDTRNNSAYHDQRKKLLLDSQNPSIKLKNY